MSDENILNIAIAGIGVVGSGVVKILEKDCELIEKKCGKRINIKYISAKNRNKDRGFDVLRYVWEDDPLAIAEKPDCDLIVELIGGEEGVAKELVSKALSNGIHVVTANKALIAHHGYELAMLAEKQNKVLAFEASVAGGIPILKSIKEGLPANEFNELHGILNGTCNYVLCEMQKSDRDFKDVLAEAQNLGYAEADPTLDIGGFDSAHKLCILSSLIYGTIPDYNAVSVTGIENVTATDIKAAFELGYVIKLLGTAKKTGANKILQSVEPCLVPKASPMASINGVFNAVQAITSNAGRYICSGKGAGQMPTASAIISDIIDIAKGYNPYGFGIKASSLARSEKELPENIIERFYIRCNVTDRPGVIADISSILRDNNISIESILQHGRDPEHPVNVVLITHETSRKSMTDAITAIDGLETVLKYPCVMRIENDQYE